MTESKPSRLLRNKNIIVFTALNIILITYRLILKFFFPDFNEKELAAVIYQLICILVMFAFTDVFKKNISAAKETPIKNKLIVIGIFILLAVGKIIITVKACMVSDYKMPFEKIVVSLLSGLLAGFAEEYMFDGLLFEELKNEKLPYILTLIIPSAVFAVLHLDFSFPALFAMFLFRLEVLIAYRYYPSILFFSIYHSIWDIMFYIPFI